MGEINLLQSYPKSNASRKFVKRSIADRIVAVNRDKSFFDESRSTGYGGLRQDNRWDLVSPDFYRYYNLSKQSKLLQLNCEKGFLLSSFAKLFEMNNLYGTENSEYAISNTFSTSQYHLIRTDPLNLPFNKFKFDLVIAIGVIYIYTLKDALSLLKSVDKISHNSFVTLATYKSKRDYWKFKNWSLLANLILTRDEWYQVMKTAGYDGDFLFIDADYLGL